MSDRKSILRFKGKKLKLLKKISVWNFENGCRLLRCQINDATPINSLISTTIDFTLKMWRIIRRLKNNRITS